MSADNPTRYLAWLRSVTLSVANQPQKSNNSAAWNQGKATFLETEPGRDLYNKTPALVKKPLGTALADSEFTATIEKRSSRVNKEPTIQPMPDELWREKNTSISISSDTDEESTKNSYVTSHTNREFLQENRMPDETLHQQIKDCGTGPDMLNNKNVSTEQSEATQPVRDDMTNAQQELMNTWTKKTLTSLASQAEGAENQKPHKKEQPEGNFGLAWKNRGSPGEDQESDDQDLLSEPWIISGAPKKTNGWEKKDRWNESSFTRRTLEMSKTEKASGKRNPPDAALHEER